MEYTKNYHLPQWVESDRILMEDFNDAMEKIDAAVAAKADGAATEEEAAALEQRITAAEQSIRFLKLGGPVVTTAADQTVTFQLTNINPADYTALLVVAGAAHSNSSVELHVNGNALMTLCDNNWSETTVMAWIMPGSGKVLGFSQGCQSGSSAILPAGGAGTLELNWNNISSISTAGRSNAGMRCALYGLKG